MAVICVGDSHTFGASLPPEDAYPAQLQERFDRSGREPQVRFLNLGIPGQNSAMVTNRLAEQIEVYDADLVIVWVGVNDVRNFNEFDQDPGDSSSVRRVR